MWNDDNNKKSSLGLTMVEKILSMHAGKIVKHGEICVVDIDFAFGQDGTSSVIIDSFREMGAEKVFDKNKCAIILDHSCPSPIVGVSNIHKKIREFVKETGIILHDIGDGVCHELVPSNGYIKPGDLVLGADSHTCTYGALNMCSTGMGSTDIAAAMIAGKTWLKVPETIKFIINGKLQKGVYSKDLILYLIGKVTADGATYKACEYTGEAIEDLSIEARMTVCNMAIEMGAKFGIMNFDKKLEDWLKKKGINNYKIIESDDNASYFKVYEYDATKITPQIAMPHTVDNVASIDDVKGIHIDEAYLGTCTNGRIEDLEIAAKILKGKKINKDVRFIVAPASREIYLEAMEKGLIKIFVESGAAVVSPGCGCCVGTHNGVPSDGENVISTANRNFKGRMGNNKAFIHLASPATVVASAIEGKIADPRNYID